MSADHKFIDSSGSVIAGKRAGLTAWQNFFEAFPGYYNEFLTFNDLGDEVHISGYSHCSDPRLRGPALWSVSRRHGAVTEWRVFDDTPEARVKLKLGIEMPGQ